MSISIELLISRRQHGESHFQLVLTESCSGDMCVGGLRVVYIHAIEYTVSVPKTEGK